jgi:hypothetical protein
MAKQCTKCGKVKDYSQFSKLTKSKDGHQFHCKECNNKENYRFRHEIDPEYMNRWFSDNKEHWNEYITTYSKVGDTNTIYSITAPDGMVYIGHTQRKKRFRLAEHKKFYKSREQYIPLLYNSYDKWGIQNHVIEILKEWKGTKDEGLAIESKLIQFYKGINKSLNVKN